MPSACASTAPRWHSQRLPVPLPSRNPCSSSSGATATARPPRRKVRANLRAPALPPLPPAARQRRTLGPPTRAAGKPLTLAASSSRASPRAKVAAPAGVPRSPNPPNATSLSALPLAMAQPPALARAPAQPTTPLDPTPPPPSRAAAPSEPALLVPTRSLAARQGAPSPRRPSTKSAKAMRGYAASETIPHGDFQSARCELNSAAQARFVTRAHRSVREPSWSRT